MTRTEHLLVMLAEECSEVAQRASKALRFGLAEVQPGQELTNAQRIAVELIDLAAVMEMIDEEVNGAAAFAVGDPDAALAAKKVKVEKFLRYSAECGTLDNPPTGKG